MDLKENCLAMFSIYDFSHIATYILAGKGLQSFFLANNFAKWEIKLDKGRGIEITFNCMAIMINFGIQAG